MKTKTIFCFLIAVIFVTSASAQERGPAVVSPGSDVGIAIVGESCPTFSWTGVEWATAYRVAVFEAVSAEALSYEEMETIASPVLNKEIQGRALSWTPSSDDRLSSGSIYVWYVMALDGIGQGIWSEGRMFRVETEVQFVGMEDSVRKSLREKGMSEEAIEDVLEDMRLGTKEVVAYAIETGDGEVGAQDKMGIQGLEDSTNTFYGLDAGFNTTGAYNSFFGRSAGLANNIGDYNTFMGYYAGHSNTIGSENTFMGNRAGYSNTIGYCNTFMGNRAGYSNTIGYSNTFIGHRAGYYNSTGYYNTFMGYYAGHYNTAGNNNAFFGIDAGYNNSTGSYNTFIGQLAGASNMGGQYNVFLGYKAGYNETGSNKLYIDNSMTASPLIYGEFDNDILAVNGKLGVGTQSPGFPMHLRKTGSNAAFIADRTDGAMNYINATSGYGNFGTVNNYPLRMVVNAVWRMRLDSDNSLTMANGATCTAGGVWTDASSIELKENIHSLTTEEAIDALNGLNPVKYNYKTDKDEDCVGFIAEEVPDLVASKDRKGMSPMDVVAVLTKVVQEQQEIIGELRKEIDELKNKK